MPPACPGDRSVFRYTNAPIYSPFPVGGKAADGKGGEEQENGNRVCSGEREPPLGKPGASNGFSRKVSFVTPGSQNTGWFETTVMLRAANMSTRPLRYSMLDMIEFSCSHVSGDVD